MLEDIKAAGEGAVAPDVSQIAFGAVPLHIFDNDALENVTAARHLLHAIKAKGDPFTIGIHVTYDQYEEAAQIEKWRDHVDNLTKSFNKNLFA